ncbi:unnamed protein product [Acanthoscelides obtectus]|uniref:Uncharacterized protein n=1 Tax=Acanthoscelides obtectus TaxID=200917 RepID=A0A9P0LBK6_ACAOB|nr:unnamed protein product [Acanthoscelides obtectus]CAK1635403.1 hypothetical protein AOBTE_LOCUS9257 [Acanthoscelides obtectus]
MVLYFQAVILTICLLHTTSADSLVDQKLKADENFLNGQKLNTNGNFFESAPVVHETHQSEEHSTGPIIKKHVESHHSEDSASESKGSKSASSPMSMDMTMGSGLGMGMGMGMKPMMMKPITGGVGMGVGSLGMGMGSVGMGMGGMGMMKGGMGMMKGGIGMMDAGMGVGHVGK